jgi:hypothetical protein
MRINKSLFVYIIKNFSNIKISILLYLMYYKLNSNNDCFNLRMKDISNNIGKSVKAVSDNIKELRYKNILLNKYDINYDNELLNKNIDENCICISDDFIQNIDKFHISQIKLMCVIIFYTQESKNFHISYTDFARFGVDKNVVAQHSTLLIKYKILKVQKDSTHVNAYSIISLIPRKKIIIEKGFFDGIF